MSDSNELYSSIDIRTINRTTMRWAGYAARMGKMHKGVDGKNPNERDHLEDRGVHGRILKWILKRCEGAKCIYLTHDRDQWCDLLNTVMG